MRSFVLLIVIFLATLPVSSYAKKRAVLIGGSGEDFKDENFFKEDFVKLKSNLEARGWEVEVLFNGSNHEIEGAKRATNENISTSLNRVREESKKGDQVLVFLHSHGKKRKRKIDEYGYVNFGSEQKTHPLVTEHPDGFDLDQLEDFTQEVAGEKQAELALVDLSCFSGNTQSLATGGSQERVSSRESIRKNLCIATLASKDYVSICGGVEQNAFTRKFIDIPKNGSLSLQDQFLAARRSDHSPANLPQISSLYTPGITLWDKFFKQTDPSNYERLTALSNISTFPMSPQECREVHSTYETEIENIIAYFQGIVDRSEEEEFRNLENSLREYLLVTKKLDQIVSELVNELKGKIDWGFPESLSWLNNLSIGDMKGVLEILESKTDLKDVAWLSPEEAITLMGMKQRVKDLRQRYESYTKEIEDEWEKYEELEAELGSAASKVAKSERNLFDRFHSNEKDESNNPCSRFSL